MVKKGLKNTFNQLKKRLVNNFSFRVIILIALQLTIFMMDLFLPFSTATIVAYIAIVQITLWLPKSQHTLYASIASTVFISLGFFLNPTDESFLNVLINRGLALTAVWVTALFVLRYERAVMKIGESESFKVLFKSAGEGLIIVNKWGNIVSSNPELSKMFGYSQQELKDKNLKELMPERFWNKYKAFKKKFYQAPQVIHAGEDHEGETFYGLRNDGREFPIEVGLGFYKTVGEVLTVIFAIDITKRKEAENQLMESKEWLSNFMDSSPSYISILDDQLRIVDCNKRMLEVFDATIKEDVIGKHLAELYPNIKEGEDLEKYKTVLNFGEPLTFEKEVEHPLFGQKYYRFSLFKAGRGLGSIIEDITKEKLAGKKITESRERLSNFIDATKQYITILDKDLHIIDCNKPILKMLNVDAKEEVIGKSLADFSPEIQSNGRLELYKKVLKTGKRVEYDQEVDHPLLGHKYFHIRLFRADHGIGSIIEDVTDKYEIEIALGESEKRFRLAAMGASSGIWEWNIVSGEVWWTDTFYELLGYQSSEFSGSYEKFEKLLHPDDLEPMQINLNGHLQEKSPFSKEYRLKTRNGQYKWFLVTGQAEWNTEGEPIKMAGSIVDINERKLAEEALKHSEERYTLAQQAANIGSWDWDIPKGNLEWSDTIEAMFGFKPGKFGKTYDAFLENVHPEDRQFVIDSVNASVEENKDYDIEHRIICPNKTVHWISEKGEVIRDKKGKAIRMLGIVMDITDRKYTEEALKLSEERYALAQRAANIGSWDWDIPTGNLEWSDTIETMFGFKSGKFGKTYDAFLDTVHPEDRQFVIDSVDASVRKGKDYDIEHRIVCPDKTVHWISEKGDVIRDKKGKAIRMLGIARDITEQKKMEDTLLETEENYRLTLSNISDAVFVTDDKGNLTFICPNVNVIFGYSVDEIKKLGNISKILGNPIIELNELNSKGEITNIEHEISNKVGKKRLVLINVKKVDIKGGTVLYTCHDITKWRQAEEKLIEAHAFVDSIVENIPNVVFVKEPKELRYVKVNKVLEDLIGHKRDDLIGENDYSFFLKKEADFFTKQDREVLKTGKLLDIPRESIELKNEKRVFHTKKIPILDKENKPQYLLGVSEDITDRVALEEELNTSAKRMEATLNASQDAIVTASENETIAFFNPSAEKLFGYKLNEVIDKPLTILLPKRYIKKHKIGITRYKKTRKAHIIGKGSVEMHGKKKDGTEFPLEFTLGTWSTENGTFFTAVIRDISKRKKLEKRLEENKIVLP